MLVKQVQLQTLTDLTRGDYEKPICIPTAVSYDASFGKVTSFTSKEKLQSQDSC